ncbi:vrr-nuc [Niveomyces insectorum RCEF 264]|uniref:Fanconi-associated nuclease n=1 Tax=Niveomyces insectorum RCEF 264 TaxID=1081102 RepID=A0A167WZG7_9HYPO|nr:vrr-nuc [Niveomyces insectorum RCEF 264]
MDKFIRRIPLAGQDTDKVDGRPLKRPKIENESAKQGKPEALAANITVNDDDDDGYGSGSGSPSSRNTPEPFSFEEPLALTEFLDDVDDKTQDGAISAGPKAPRAGRSAIYVDAFNIALHTVLEQEKHLFDEKERAIFDAWGHLGYEAQCLSPESAERETFAGVAPCAWVPGSSFAFVESFLSINTTIKDAVSLLSLDELKVLAKELKANGKTKAALQSALVNTTTKQTSLAFTKSRRQPRCEPSTSSTVRQHDKNNEQQLATKIPGLSDREGRLFHRIMAITGPCVRLSPAIFKLFERVHLVFYRTSEWTEKSLTTIVLARISRRRFPDYVVSRTANIFQSRRQLLDFEAALRLEHEVDQTLDFSSSLGNERFDTVVSLFEQVSEIWRRLLREEQNQDYGDDHYLRRFRAAHVYTRIAHYAAHSLGRLRAYRAEYALLKELLDQRLFHKSRRGSWYQRKALLEEHYMAADEPTPPHSTARQTNRLWCQKAIETCEQALQDSDCHLVYHYDLQKRIVKLEKRLRVPRRLQHQFGHLQLLAPEQHTVEGVQTKRGIENAFKIPGQSIGVRTTWLDPANNNAECTVEAMCLSSYCGDGWKGFHSEGGIVRTLFAYLFYDILFLSVPNVFQTAYQMFPLDLHTDAFYAARASEINRRLVEIANGEAEHFVRAVHASHFEQRTCILGLDWDFDVHDVIELVQCFHGEALAIVCKVLAQEYRQRVSGLPDLLLWRTSPKPEVLFVEVKSANDRLSDTQRMWIHVLAGAGVRVAVCNAVAREVKAKG